ncbi:predicted protein [Naegleria gruberi]|uniref:Predicted protein n=1 Tax=Naegleria gruberi TaxID=5762 RepID=D2V3P0_NAEGR|nr:uncharacterized protein NAEGRDRAFT_63434 [Naegleria gruberi]EFC48804.1 predicted protein [Naegleria gruberi]|eukprot:XP_002681548.1 predicted protein [Naegleria gruberi strain NEG-M]
MKKRESTTNPTNKRKKSKANEDDDENLVIFNNFIEKIPREILIHILQFVPKETRVCNLVHVSKMFHEVMVDPESECFNDVIVRYPLKRAIPNMSLVRSLKFAREFVPDEEEDDENLSKLNRVERLRIPLMDDYYFLPFIEKYFKKLKYLYYGYVFSDQVWKIVKKIPSLEVLRVFDFADLECGCEEKLALTELEVIENFSYATYGYSENGPLNVYGSLDVIFSCSPNFGRIMFHPDAFCVNISQIYKIVTRYSKQLKSVTISVMENSEEEENADQYIVQKVEFDCSFLKLKADKAMAIVLKYLFPNCKITKLSYPYGKAITTSLLKSRRILKNNSDLKELDVLLTNSLRTPHETKEEEEEFDEEINVGQTQEDNTSDEDEEDEEDEEEENEE